MVFEFKLPELGENIESGDVVNVLVKVGDAVTKDQPLMELETDKAVLEVPSPVNGTVTAINVVAGGKAHVGELIMSFEESEGAVVSTPPPAPKVPASAPEPTPFPEMEPVEVEEEAVAAPSPPTPSPPTAPVLPPALAGNGRAKGVPVAASPSVRRFARELGVDINIVTGSGARGRISAEDVKAFVKTRFTSASGGAVSVGAIPLPDFSKWGDVERKPMSNVRRKTAENLSAGWATGPQVTQYDKCDITELEALRKKHVTKAEAAGGKLTMTAIILKVCAHALKVFPQFNASIDMAASEIVYKEYFNIGVAADTERGLLVPVLKNVERKNIIELSVELGKLAKKARDRKLTLEEMAGGNFTISNLGGIGGVGFSPIVYQPEVAILGVSRASIEPKWNGSEFLPRLILPLSLSYDHRLIDGADAARFLRWVCEALEEPFLLSLEGA